MLGRPGGTVVGASAKGVFPAFVRFLGKEWPQRWSGAAPIRGPRGHWLRKSNTFDLGATNPFDVQLLVHLQASSKPWGGGDFTVNIVLTTPLESDPTQRSPNFVDFDRGALGNYRLGNLLYGQDKWWSLVQNDSPHMLEWKASSYSSRDRVFSEAAEDLTKDVEKASERLGHHLGK